PAPSAEMLLERAVRPDLFYLGAMRQSLASSPHAAALYLPGLDIAAADWQGSDVAFGDLVRSVLLKVDRLIGEAGDYRTVALVADSGRRGGGEGRVLLLRRGCGGESTIRPEAGGSFFLGALGLPKGGGTPRP